MPAHVVCCMHKGSLVGCLVFLPDKKHDSISVYGSGTSEIGMHCMYTGKHPQVDAVLS